MISYPEYIKRVITFFAIALLLVTFWQLRNVFMLALLASIIAVSLSIPVTKLQQLGLNRSVSILLTVLAVILASVFFFAWALPTLVLQFASLAEGLPSAVSSIRQFYNEWYSSQSLTMRRLLLSLDDTAASTLSTQAGAIISPVVTIVGSGLLSFIGNLFIVVVVAVFLLLEPKGYAGGFITLLPTRYRERALEVIVELRITLTSWLTALTFSITITAFLTWLVLGVILGIPNSFGLGVIAGLATVIPNIGAAIPIIPIALFTLSYDPSKLIFALPAYIAIQLFESNILTPSFVRKQMNIPAALILLFQLIAATVFGFLGILLAVPLLAILITLVRELYVYDVLGMRGTTVHIEEVEGETDALKLVTVSPEGDITQTVAEPEALPPEEIPGWQQG